MVKKLFELNVKFSLRRILDGSSLKSLDKIMIVAPVEKSEGEK